MTYVQELMVLDVTVPGSVHVVASVVVCDAQRCLPPQELELTIELPSR